MLPKSMEPETGDERVKVKLDGREYLRQQTMLHEGSEICDCFEYASKLDDNLMCCVSIAIWSDKTPEDYEKLISALNEMNSVSQHHFRRFLNAFQAFHILQYEI